MNSMNPTAIVRRKRRAVPAIVLAAALASLLGGCAMQSNATDDKVGSYMVSPGKYQFYTCAHLAAATVTFKTRERELEALMAKAGTDSGGRFVASIAYRPEYIQVRGNLIEVRKVEAEKNCPAVAAVEAPPASAGAGPPRRKR
jgi:hypothetical protein